MSGLSRTPGKRVRVNSPPRVRIPPSPPISSYKENKTSLLGWFFIFVFNYFLASSDLNQPPTVLETES